MMKKIFAIILTFLLTLTFLAGCSPVNQEETIKVGFVSTLSGEAGSWGQQVKKGFEFALEEINTNKLLGDKKLEIFYEDDFCDATNGLTAFNKLIDVNDVQIIVGTVCSSVAMAVSEKTQSNHILYLASAATNPEVTEQGDFIFRLWASDDYDAKAIAQFAVNELRLETFAVTYVNDNPAGPILKDAFKETILKKGKKILAEESYSSKETDFKTHLIKILQKNPEAVYLMTNPERTDLIINQIRQLGFEGIIFAYGPSITSEGVVEKIKDKKDIYYALPVSKQETLFWNKYKEKKGEDADSLVALGYDSMKILVDGIKKCDVDTGCLREYLLKLKDYESARGKLNFDSEGALTNIEFEVKKIKFKPYPILHSQL